MRRALAAAVALWPVMAWAESGSQVQVVALVDIIPEQAGAALPILVAHVADLQHAPGVLHAALLQEEGRPNHFTLVETLRDRAAYDALAASAGERRFRRVVFPLLGSPYDERLSREVAP